MSDLDDLDPLADDVEARREVAWIARRARELVFARPFPAPAAEYVEFFARKVRLLRYIGTTEALAQVPENLEHLEEHRRQLLTPPPAPNAGEQLDAIMRDLDATTAAWAAVGHPYGGQEWEAREAVFLRLRAWNAEREPRPPRG